MLETRNMNIYYAELILRGTITYEDPHCPTSWMGSGVYDIDEDVETEGSCYVVAETEEKARQLIDEYDFMHLDFQLEEVEIKSIALNKRDVDENAGVWDEFIKDLPERDYEPDPDARYD